MKDIIQKRLHSGKRPIKRRLRPIDCEEQVESMYAAHKYST